MDGLRKAKNDSSSILGPNEGHPPSQAEELWSKVFLRKMCWEAASVGSMNNAIALGNIFWKTTCMSLESTTSSIAYSLLFCQTLLAAQLLSHVDAYSLSCCLWLYFCFVILVFKLRRHWFADWHAPLSSSHAVNLLRSEMISWYVFCNISLNTCQLCHPLDCTSYTQSLHIEPLRFKFDASTRPPHQTFLHHWDSLAALVGSVWGALLAVKLLQCWCSLSTSDAASFVPICLFQRVYIYSKR